MQTYKMKHAICYIGEDGQDAGYKITHPKAENVWLMRWALGVDFTGVYAKGYHCRPRRILLSLAAHTIFEHGYNFGVMRTPLAEIAKDAGLELTGRIVYAKIRKMPDLVVRRYTRMGQDKPEITFSIPTLEFAIIAGFIPGKGFLHPGIKKHIEEITANQCPN